MTDFPGWLFTLVGPAGAGKNHLMRTALTRVSGLTQLPTATTRRIREGEQEGREHYYLTRPAFEQLIADDALLEHQVIHGNLYGMLRKTVEEALSAGRCVIADIDIFGALRARDLFPQNTISIFIQPPSIATLVERMRVRGDREAEIAKRLVRVPVELEQAERCDYHILNDNAERAGELLVAMLESVIAHRPMAQPEHERPTTRDFCYKVAAVPIFGTERLKYEAESANPLVVDLPSGDLYPHRAALNAISDVFGVKLDDADIIGGEPDGAFIPPTSFNCVEMDGEERITFVYHLRMPERIVSPEWAWTPLETLIPAS